MSDNSQETGSSAASSNDLGIQPNSTFPFPEEVDKPFGKKPTPADEEAMQEDRRLPMI